jgi:hypothetical protein
MIFSQARYQGAVGRCSHACLERCPQKGPRVLLVARRCSHSTRTASALSALSAQASGFPLEGGRSRVGLRLRMAPGLIRFYALESLHLYHRLAHGPWVERATKKQKLHPPNVKNPTLSLPGVAFSSSSQTRSGRRIFSSSSIRINYFFIFLQMKFSAPARPVPHSRGIRPDKPRFHSPYAALSVLPKRKEAQDIACACSAALEILPKRCEVLSDRPLEKGCKGRQYRILPVHLFLHCSRLSGPDLGQTCIHPQVQHRQGINLLPFVGSNSLFFCFFFPVRSLSLRTL